MEWRSRLACHFLVLGCTALDEDDVDDDIWEEREGRKEDRKRERGRRRRKDLGK